MSPTKDPALMDQPPQRHRLTTEDDDRLQAVEATAGELHHDYARLEDRTRSAEQRLAAHDVHQQHLAAQMAELLMAVQGMHTELRGALADAAALRAEMNGKIDVHIREEGAWFKSAIPEGDADAHRRDHEDRARRAADDAKNWADLKQHLLRQGSAAALMGLLGLVAVGALAVLATKLGIKTP
jgi:chromosome segregation ATPase